MSILRKIMETCKDTQYCHECSVRDFCTQLRSKPPKYWQEKIVDKYEPAEAPAKKTTKKKKGE